MRRSARTAVLLGVVAPLAAGRFAQTGRDMVHRGDSLSSIAARYHTTVAC